MSDGLDAPDSKTRITIPHEKAIWLNPPPKTIEVPVGKPIAIRMQEWKHVPSQKGFQTIAEIIEDQNKTKELLAKLAKKLNNLRQEFGHLAEAGGVFGSITPFINEYLPDAVEEIDPDCEE